MVQRVPTADRGREGIIEADQGERGTRGSTVGIMRSRDASGGPTATTAAGTNTAKDLCHRGMQLRERSHRGGIPVSTTRHTNSGSKNPYRKDDERRRSRRGWKPNDDTTSSARGA